ncbi:hypothetical protein Rsub_10008 [Raphidocelis subcapitata]|uniref:Uncharacterized protein n=1 Tax=Raphidocelis subcapitata TaxID=307507 RepID=A0A2V0PJ20_9CHLO|nr:hypothetical protein Rsub_10008 [Raphidocelis subcapitata]|eukprot:GBF97317.1 hypothetical protein Rsub_10008 [Raphidocelis subcapitata]
MARSGPQELGLELKARFASMILDGGKTVELRSYAIPERWLGRPVLLLATPDGSEGRSTLPPDVLPADFPGVHVVNRCLSHAWPCRCCRQIPPPPWFLCLRKTQLPHS